MGFWAVEVKGAEVAAPREPDDVGYASEAASACLRFGFEKLTLKQIVAFTDPLQRHVLYRMNRS